MIREVVEWISDHDEVSLIIGAAAAYKLIAMRAAYRKQFLETFDITSHHLDKETGELHVMHYAPQGSATTSIPLSSAISDTGIRNDLNKKFRRHLQKTKWDDPLVPLEHKEQSALRGVLRATFPSDVLPSHEEVTETKEYIGAMTFSRYPNERNQWLQKVLPGKDNDIKPDLVIISKNAAPYDLGEAPSSNENGALNQWVRMKVHNTIVSSYESESQSSQRSRASRTFSFKIISGKHEKKRILYP